MSWNPWNCPRPGSRRRWTVCSRSYRPAVELLEERRVLTPFVVVPGSTGHGAADRPPGAVRPAIGPGTAARGRPGRDPAAPGAIDYPVHSRITATIFWVGEPADADNAHISNLQSAWDDHWVEHYGGVDDPAHRHGFNPAGFMPRENPFYVALPYNDFTAGGRRKPRASRVVYWAGAKPLGATESMLKNRWIRIVNGDRVAYAQWEDVGPFGENDPGYVFGHGLPRNRLNHRAGLDVSPAVRDFLGLVDDVTNSVSWQFVDPQDIAPGPWTEIVTTSPVNWGTPDSPPPPAPRVHPRPGR